MMTRKEVKKVTKYLNFEVTDHKSTGDELVIEGYANTSSKDRVGDVVLPTAFEKTLPVYLKNPVLLENHNLDRVAGRVLEAKITDKGLYIKARISDTRSDLKTQIKEGCLSTFSIGYNETDSDFDEATKTRVIKELELLEISIVTVPANTEASFSIAQTKVDPPAAATEAPKCEKCGTLMEKAADSDEYKCMKCMKALDSPLAVVSPPAKPPKCEWCDEVMARADGADSYHCEQCAKKSAANEQALLSLREISEIATKAFGSIDNESLVDLFDLYNKEGNIMKKLDKEKLIEVLKSAIKSDPAAVTPPAAPATTQKDDPAMAAASPDYADMWKQVLAKLDAIGQALAQLLEGGKPAAEEPKAADPAAPAPAPVEGDGKGLEALSDKEIQELETDILKQLDELEDNT